MSISSSSKAKNPRQKSLKHKGEKTMENSQGQNMNIDKVDQNGDKLVQLELPGKLEVHDTISSSGIRPVSSSDLEVVETMNVMGIRPISANTFHVVETIHVSGDRPIASSDLVISETYSVMGNRPVASNTIDDSESLMGFLD